MESGGRWGYIDRHGAVVIKPVYSTAGDFSEGLAVVAADGPSTFIDKNGAVAVAGSFERAKRFGNGLAPVRNGTGWAYIDRSGTIVIPGPFEIAESFSQERAAVRTGGAWGYVDKSGTLVIPTAYSFGGTFVDGLAPVTCRDGAMAGLTGFIDRDGKVAIPCRFAAALSFAEGLAPVQIGHRWGYADRDGKVAIAAHFAQALPFDQGLARVVDGVYARAAYIDSHGESVFDASDTTEQGLGTFRTVKVSITSNPTGARFYLVPMLDVTEDPTVLHDLTRLRKKYRVKGGDSTPVTTSVYEQHFALMYETPTGLHEKDVIVIGGNNEVQPIEFDVNE